MASWSSWGLDQDAPVATPWLLGCLPASLPPYLGFTVSEHVPAPKGRYQGVTAVRNHLGVLVSVRGTGDGGPRGAGGDPCGRPLWILALADVSFSGLSPAISLINPRADGGSDLGTLCDPAH